MRTRIPLIAAIGTVLLAACDSQRDQVIDDQASKVEVLVRVGDDIHEAKSKLEAEGFRIEYGPDFPTKTQKYLMMIVDYGVSPTKAESFGYAVGMGGGKALDGVIKATPEGVITSIE